MKTWWVALLALLAAGQLAGQQQDKPAEKNRLASSAGLSAKVPDRGKAYYHYALAHLYEEMGVAHNRQEYFTKAIEEYKQAMQYDPGSAYLSAELADLYAHTGRIRDAVLEAEEVLKRDPSNIEARRLLGRIYIRVLGDPPGGKVQGDVLRRAIEQYQTIVEYDPKDIEARLTLGRLYRINNDFLKAETVLKQALALQPDNEDVLTTLAFLYTDTSQFKSAIELLEKVTAKNPNPKLFATLGAAQEQARDYPQAVQAYRKALELDKDNLEYKRALGQNLIYSEQYDEAIEHYQAIAAAEPQDGNAFLRLGQVYRQQRKFDLALENLKKAGTLMSDSLEVPYNLALLHEAQGRPEEAVQILKKMLDQTAKPGGTEYSAREKSNRAIFLERLGIVYRSLENYEAAEDAFRKVAADGDQENVVRGISQVVETLRQAKQLPRAVTEAEAGVKRFPDDRNLKMLYASVLGETGRVDRGLEMLKGLLQNKPEDREVLLAMAQAYERAKRYPEAEQAVAAAEKYAGRKEEQEYVYFLRGSILERQKKYDQAEQQFKKVLALNPNSAMALNYLGYMLGDRGVRLEEAKKYVQAALEQDPNNGAYLDSMGWVYFKMNRLELAEQYLLKAIQRISRDATIHDHLGDVYYQTGRVREALLQWQKALAEWERAGAAEADPQEVAKVQKKLEDAKVRLAKETSKQQQQ